MAARPGLVVEKRVMVRSDTPTLPAVTMIGSDRVPGDADAHDRVGVTIAVDHPLVRDAVRRSCDRVGAVQVLAEVADAQALLAACRERAPTVIVLDDELGGGHGLEALRAVREQGVPRASWCSPIAPTVPRCSMRSSWVSAAISVRRRACVDVGEAVVQDRGR